LFDVEGFSTIHLATMFAHSNVVAYLLVKGIDTDMLDQNGVTPLMYAAQRVHNRDPAQLLITFNARLNAQDPKGNTPLHYCVAFNNAAVMQVLLDKGASLDILNKKGQTALEFAKERKKNQAVNLMKSYSDHDKENLPKFLLPLTKNKDIRKRFTQIYPFLILFYLGFTFSLELNWFLKAVVLLIFYPITYAFQRFFFDKNVTKYTPMATTCAFISWLYLTWFIYFRPFVFDFSLYSFFFAFSTSLSWYNFYKCYKSDPGVLSSNRDQMNKTILQFVEQNEFSVDSFCTACIIRKPLRSKHCADCDRCVAKFDHHCPWVDNCVGQQNLKYFIGFLFWTPICLAYFMHGAMTHYTQTCYATDIVVFKKMSEIKLVYQFMMCSPWVSFFTLVAGTILFWMFALFVCHFYQAVFVSLTTNERMNMHRYKHFFESKTGKFANPFNFGILQNFVDLIDMRIFCLKPSLVNWKKEHDIQDVINSRLDRKKEKGSFDV
jgi:palmitoyltransferase